MTMLFLSLFTGFIGLMLGGAIGMETFGSVLGFFTPSIVMLQNLYIKVEDMEKRSLENDGNLDNAREDC